MKNKLEEIPLGRAENLALQKFGHLTALYRVANYQNRPTWQCQCDCGNYFVATAKALKNGSTLSCGCAKNETHIKDHTGETYGSLTVLRLHPERSSSGTLVWECQCKCGNISLVRASNLKSAKSCGQCFKGKNIAKQRFGNLVAIRYHHTSNSKKSMWECQCDCGAISYVNVSDLTTGKAQSCGCIRSRGEALISQLLLDNNIYFEKQKVFDTCRFPETNYPALFDFYVNNEYLIEYDGIQHFKSLGGWSNEEALQQTKQRDYIKDNWCKKNNIPLIRIPYTHLSQLSINDLKLETSKFII